MFFSLLYPLRSSLFYGGIEPRFFFGRSSSLFPSLSKARPTIIRGAQIPLTNNGLPNILTAPQSDFLSDRIDFEYGCRFRIRASNLEFYLLM